MERKQTRGKIDRLTESKAGRKHFRCATGIESILKGKD